MIITGAGIPPVNLMRLFPNTISEIHPLAVSVVLLCAYNLTLIMINLKRSSEDERE
ncbi:hypothetical protein MQE36_02790 [Zhouia spongiae]|uniref:Uncharacterized protein n=1 Tax=Zhouia spongiae TaxID=2202721 RepID=A0ABY3YP17_9FLAO|nr:hypothetical protein [Zhouia spongiae]UNY99279.1 hypothetical protein MQE36_02790 [Zhouia spongiae]